MTGKEITEIIDVIANKLGTTSEHLIEVYTPWVYSSAIGFVVFGVLALIVGFLFMIKLWNQDKGFAIFASVVGFIISAFCCLPFIPDIFAPEAAAITKIISTISRF